MSSGPALYAVTATLVADGRTVDLLGYRTVRSDEIDDTCQDFRRKLRPAHGEGLRIEVEPC